MSFLLLIVPVSANPSGPTVRHGRVQITAGSQAQIRQLTNKAIIDWQSFSIGAGESVRFVQPGSQSLVLNRVVGQDPSAILGSLSANGRVFLVNPNGILFGPGSTVNVGGLVASTLNITDEDFLSSNYAFQADQQNLGDLVNRGTITVSDGGFLVLAGPGARNEGFIVARSAKVALFSGERVTLNLDGRDLIHYTTRGLTQEPFLLLSAGQLGDNLAATFGVPRSQMADQMVRRTDGSVVLARSGQPQVLAQTLNQGATTVVVTVVLNPVVADQTPDDVPASAFAQNNADLVESVIQQLLDPSIFDQELDPTSLPQIITEEDFLQKKFRY